MDGDTKDGEKRKRRPTLMDRMFRNGRKDMRSSRSTGSLGLGSGDGGGTGRKSSVPAMEVTWTKTHYDPASKQTRMRKMTVDMSQYVPEEPAPSVTRGAQWKKNECGETVDTLAKAQSDMVSNAVWRKNHFSGDLNGMDQLSSFLTECNGAETSSKRSSTSDGVAHEVDDGAGDVMEIVEKMGKEARAMIEEHSRRYFETLFGFLLRAYEHEVALTCGKTLAMGSFSEQVDSDLDRFIHEYDAARPVISLEYSLGDDGTNKSHSSKRKKKDSKGEKKGSSKKARAKKKKRRNKKKKRPKSVQLSEVDQLIREVEAASPQCDTGDDAEGDDPPTAPPSSSASAEQCVSHRVKAHVSVGDGHETSQSTSAAANDSGAATTERSALTPVVEPAQQIETVMALLCQDSSDNMLEQVLAIRDGLHDQSEAKETGAGQRSSPLVPQPAPSSTPQKQPRKATGIKPPRPSAPLPPPSPVLEQRGGKEGIRVAARPAAAAGRAGAPKVVTEHESGTASQTSGGAAARAPLSCPPSRPLHSPPPHQFSAGPGAISPRSFASAATERVREQTPKRAARTNTSPARMVRPSRPSPKPPAAVARPSLPEVAVERKESTPEKKVKKKLFPSLVGGIGAGGGRGGARSGAGGGGTGGHRGGRAASPARVEVRVKARATPGDRPTTPTTVARGPIATGEVNAVSRSTTPDAIARASSADSSARSAPSERPASVPPRAINPVKRGGRGRGRIVSVGNRSATRDPAQPSSSDCTGSAKVVRLDSGEMTRKQSVSDLMSSLGAGGGERDTRKCASTDSKHTRGGATPSPKSSTASDGASPEAIVPVFDLSGLDDVAGLMGGYSDGLEGKTASKSGGGSWIGPGSEADIASATQALMGFMSTDDDHAEGNDEDDHCVGGSEIDDEEEGESSEEEEEEEDDVDCEDADTGAVEVGNEWHDGGGIGGFDLEGLGDLDAYLDDAGAAYDLAERNGADGSGDSDDDESDRGEVEGLEVHAHINDREESVRSKARTGSKVRAPRDLTTADAERIIRQTLGDLYASSHDAQKHVESLLENSKKISLAEEVGRGSFGVVYSARIGNDETPCVAVKNITLSDNKQKKKLKQMYQEEYLRMKDLHQPNVIRYFMTFYTAKTSTISLVVELVKGCTVAELVEMKKKLSEPVASLIILQTVIGLQYIHDNAMIHRDLKPDNLLLDETGLLKLSDFGCASTAFDNQTKRRSAVGSPYYTAPEVIESEGYSARADIWSLGCTLLELVTGTPPYYDLNHVAALFQMVEKERPNIPTTVSEECQSFLDMCWQRDHHHRPFASNLITHPFILRHLGSSQALTDLRALVSQCVEWKRR